jgi:predicted TIM-barrel fold metal-dependent hydrolase
MMPRLLYDRLDELGLDFVVVYPTAGLRFPRIQDDATRGAVIRAYNIVSADYFKGLGDRLAPAAIIPMHTPDEAIAELEFVTKQLGSKVGMFGSNMARKVPASAANDPDTARLAVWYDVLGLDSEYDYDPVWKKCVELGIAPTFHSASSNQGLRLSPTNFTYNHIRHFAAAVSRRRGRLGQPTLRRPDRALGAAQRQGIGAHAPRQARPRQIDEPRREIRL